MPAKESEHRKSTLPPPMLLDRERGRLVRHCAHSRKNPPCFGSTIAFIIPPCGGKNVALRFFHFRSVEISRDREQKNMGFRLSCRIVIVGIRGIVIQGFAVLERHLCPTFADEAGHRLFERREPLDRFGETHEGHA